MQPAATVPGLFAKQACRLGPSTANQALSLGLQVPGDQDIADLLSALEEGSTAAAGGLYAAALPPSPADEGHQQPPLPGEQHQAEPLAAAPTPAAGTQGGDQGPAGGEQTGAEAGKVQAVCAAVRQALQSIDPVGGPKRGRQPARPCCSSASGLVLPVPGTAANRASEA